MSHSYAAESIKCLYFCVLFLFWFSICLNYSKALIFCLDLLSFFIHSFFFKIEFRQSAHLNKSMSTIFDTISGAISVDNQKITRNVLLCVRLNRTRMDHVSNEILYEFVVKLESRSHSVCVCLRVDFPLFTLIQLNYVLTDESEHWIDDSKCWDFIFICIYIYF